VVEERLQGQETEKVKFCYKSEKRNGRVSDEAVVVKKQLSFNSD
jgi:hypothetical protein